VHEVREDAGCVIHLHTPDGTAVATSSTGLLPLNQTAQLVLPDLAYHDYEASRSTSMSGRGFNAT
jgi:ribulose-5-phosphate 4-epimerase/fuculose-1-phosphate aldolase